MSDSRGLGDLGESQFANWCHQIGIKPNGSKIDKTGTLDYSIDPDWNY